MSLRIRCKNTYKAIERFIDIFQSSHVEPLENSYSGFKTRIRDLAETDVDNAQNQIKEKGYHKKYLMDGKEIVLLGIHFDSEQKNISEFTELKVLLS